MTHMVTTCEEELCKRTLETHLQFIFNACPFKMSEKCDRLRAGGNYEITRRKSALPK